MTSMQARLRLRHVRSIKPTTILVSLNVLQFCVVLLLMSSNFQSTERQPPTMMMMGSHRDGSSRIMTHSKRRTNTEHHNHHFLLAQQAQHPHPAYETTSYVLQRREGEWFPPLKSIYEVKTHTALMKRMEDLFFTSKKQRNQFQHKKRQEFLAFLRIPKTGSTSVLTLLQNTPDLYTEDIFMNEDTFEDLIDVYKNQLGCVFGYSLENHVQIPALDDYDKERWVCPHLNLGGTMKDVVEAMQYLDYTVENPGEDADVIIHPFTMVRDPFDRLVSFFYYIYDRRKHGFWKRYFSEAQYQHVLDNDLSGWVKSLYDELENEHSAMASNQMLNQQRFLSPDKSIAQELVQNGRVLMLVMECFSVSVKLLVDVFPHLFKERDLVMTSFLQQQDKMHANKRLTRPETDEEEEESDEEDESSDNDDEEEDSGEENDDAENDDDNPQNSSQNQDDDNPQNSSNQDDDNDKPMGDDDDDDESEEEEEEDSEESEEDEDAEDGEDKDNPNEEGADSNDKEPEVAEEQRRRRRLTEPDVTVLRELRQNALQWFPQHFEFYQMVVEQFKKDVEAALALEDSFLTQTEVEQCFQSLNQKAAGSINAAR